MPLDPDAGFDTVGAQILRAFRAAPPDPPAPPRKGLAPPPAGMPYQGPRWGDRPPRPIRPLLT